MPEPQPGHSAPLRQARNDSIRYGWLAVFLAALLLYGVTANRGAQWQDSGEQILRVVNGELYNPRGLALSHPLHHWLARSAIAVNLLEPCLAITLLSALAAALAVANTGGCVWTLTRSRSAALFSAASLAVAHTFWQMATRTEIYTLTAALLAGECWCLAAYATKRRAVFLWGMVLFNGLGVGNHMQASLTTPVVAFIVLHAVWRKRIGIKDVCVAAAAWLLGSLPYTGLVGVELVRSGDFLATFHSALFGQSFSEQVLNVRLSARLLALNACFLALNFPNLLIPAAGYGLARARRLGLPAVAVRALLAGLIIHACFVVRYTVIDCHTFFLPLYVLLSIFAGIGLAAVLRWEGRQARRVGVAVSAALLVLTPAVYALVPTVARSLDVLASVARNKPYRDDYVYIFTPWSVVERSAEMMSRHAVRLAGPRGLIVVEDPTAEFAVRYRALRDGGKDLTVTRDARPETITSAVDSGRAVVLVPLDADAPETVPPLGSWERVGDLYLLVVEGPDR